MNLPIIASWRILSLRQCGRACSSAATNSWSEISDPLSSSLRLAGRGFRVSRLHAAQIDAEVGAFAGAPDVDGDLRSSAVFLEETIGRLEQQAFPSAHHLRDCRLHLGCAFEVD